MILLDIQDEAGVSYYDLLEIAPADLAGLDEKQASLKVQNASKKIKGKYQKDAQRGIKEAEEMLSRVNQAVTTLKKKEDRDKYDEELQSGKGATLEILRVQRAAAAFYYDRNARFSLISRLMRQHDMSKQIPIQY